MRSMRPRRQPRQASLGMTQRLRFDFVTWFGLPGHALVGTDDWHVIWTGLFVLPHMGMVNRLLRRPGEPSRRLRLVALHEQGHFETLPAAVLLFAWLYWSRRRRGLAFSPAFLADGIAHAVAWEGLAEAWLIARERRKYLWPTRTRALAFWLAVTWSCAWIASRPATGARP
jgi:hypothetical protein